MLKVIDKTCSLESLRRLPIMVHLFQKLTLALSFLLFAMPSWATDYLVYREYGSVNHPHPSALATQFSTTEKTVLKEALTRFFDGPNEDERKLGASHPLRCINIDAFDTYTVEEIYSGKGFFDCNAETAFDYVTIKDGVAFIHLKGFPNAPTSGYWQGLDFPLSLTVKQFPNVERFVFVHGGYELNGGDTCPWMCLVLPGNRTIDEEFLDNWSANGWSRLR
ncbi:MAG: hypothetical protein AAGE89_14140 [Pseudomonadota bacterium]